jgi:hypothetical protein
MVVDIFKKTSFLFGPTSKSLWILNYKIQKQKFNLNLFSILKGCKPFGKNLINSVKFYLLMIFLNMNLHCLPCMQHLEVPFQVANMTWFK